jgi:hypothetical protein
MFFGAKKRPRLSCPHGTPTPTDWRWPDLRCPLFEGTAESRVWRGRHGRRRTPGRPLIRRALGRRAKPKKAPLPGEGGVPSNNGVRWVKRGSSAGQARGSRAWPTVGTARLSISWTPKDRRTGEAHQTFEKPPLSTGGRRKLCIPPGVFVTPLDKASAMPIAWMNLPRRTTTHSAIIA